MEATYSSYDYTKSIERIDEILSGADSSYEDHKGIPSIEMELTFEHMKVVYIRDIKATRLKWGVSFATIWLILGSSIFFVSRYSIGQ